MSMSPSVRRTPPSLRVVDSLEKAGAMDYTIVVAATASEPAPLQYIAPYAGVRYGANTSCSRAKTSSSFMMTCPSTRSLTVRMSLLIRRPPGREAYPGDVFYHSLPSAGACSQAQSDELRRRFSSLPCPSSRPRPATFPPISPQTLSPSPMVRSSWRPSCSTPVSVPL